MFFLYVGKGRCRTPGPTIPRTNGGWPRCIVAATPATPRCSALNAMHALHCNDATMQRRESGDEPGPPAALFFLPPTSRRQHSRGGLLPGRGSQGKKSKAAILAALDFWIFRGGERTR